jgi:hypothetical protein
MIQPPVQDLNRAVWRAAVEGAAQFTPVTAAIARLFQLTHPAQFERDLAEWRMTVSTSVNDHEARLQALEATYRPHMALSADAQSLALWLAGQSVRGDDHNVDFTVIQAAFPTLDARALQDAAAELRMVGLATIEAVIGDPVWSVAPTFSLFALMDPVVTLTSPQDDAVEIARQALDLDGGRIPEIAGRLGWSPRRINPALALLLPLVTTVSNEISREYITRWFAVGADERVKFRRLVANADRTGA